jgi:hypothetical protein
MVCMGTGVSWPKAALGLWLSLGCSEPETRPPAASDCHEPACIEVRDTPVMSVSYLVPVPGGGDAGAAGSGGMAPPLATLQGSVRMIVEPDLSGSVPPDAPVEVRAPGADQTVVVGAPGADGGFSMDGVLAQAQTWVAVGDFSGALGGPFVDTHQAVNSAAQLPVQLALMQRSVLEEIAQVSFSISPQLLDPSRGHAIVRFVDELGVPVVGVSVTFPTADDAGIAYDAGDLYSDALGETSVRGTAVLLNLVAAPYPGGLSSVVATVAGLPDREFRGHLAVSAAAVTLFTLPLDLSP